MTYYTHATKDEWSTRRLKVLRETTLDGHPANEIRVSVTDAINGHTQGEGASIMLTRDRVPDLIAALQRFMEETK